MEIRFVFLTGNAGIYYARYMLLSFQCDVSDHLPVYSKAVVGP
jgi:hypothetical protein